MKSLAAAVASIAAPFVAQDVHPDRFTDPSMQLLLGAGGRVGIEVRELGDARFAAILVAADDAVVATRVRHGALALAHATVLAAGAVHDGRFRSELRTGIQPERLTTIELWFQVVSVDPRGAVEIHPPVALEQLLASAFVGPIEAPDLRRLGRDSSGVLPDSEPADGPTLGRIDDRSHEPPIPPSFDGAPDAGRLDDGRFAPSRGPGG